MKYNTVFVDLDNTIWDFDVNSRTSLSLCFEQFEYQRFFKDFETFFELYHRRNDELWALYREAKISKEELNADRFHFPLQSVGVENPSLAKTFGEHYLATLAEQSALVSGAHNLLNYLKDKGYRLYILSNGFEEVQYKKMMSAKITEFFDGIVLSDHVGVNKPHPKIFEHALKEAKTTKNQVVMIGDDWEADIVGAYNFGIAQIFFNRKKFRATFAPTYEVEKLEQIKSIL